MIIHMKVRWKRGRTLLIAFCLLCGCTLFVGCGAATPMSQEKARRIQKENSGMTPEVQAWFERQGGNAARSGDGVPEFVTDAELASEQNGLNVEGEK